MNKNHPTQPASIETPPIKTEYFPDLSGPVPRFVPKKIAALALLFFLLIFVIVGYKTFQDFQKSKHSNNSIVASISPTPTLIIDQTSNWRTYVNTELNISFKHPKDWEVISSTSSSTLSIRPVIDAGPIHISARPFTGDTDLYIKEYYKSDSEDVENFTKKDLSNSVYTVTEYKIKWKDTIPAYGAGTTNDITVIESDDQKFVFENYTASENPLPQILSTFKFLK